MRSTTLAFLGISLALSLTQAGCLANQLARIGSGDPAVASYQVAPEEKDATLTCAGKPCDAAPITQTTYSPRSRPIFWTVFAAEMAACIGGYAGFFSGLHEETPSAATYVSAGVGGVFSWAALADVITFAASDDYEPRRGPPQLVTPVVGQWHGKH